MLGDYTTNQLLQLRSFYADLVDKAGDVQQRADMLLILESIDEELATREARKSA